MTVYLVISLPKLPYTHRIYIILAPYLCDYQKRCACWGLRSMYERWEVSHVQYFSVQHTHIHTHTRTHTHAHTHMRTHAYIYEHSHNIFTRIHTRTHNCTHATVSACVQPHQRHQQLLLQWQQQQQQQQQPPQPQPQAGWLNIGAAFGQSSNPSGNSTAGEEEEKCLSEFAEHRRYFWSVLTPVVTAPQVRYNFFPKLTNHSSCFGHGSNPSGSSTAGEVSHLKMGTAFFPGLAKHRSCFNCGSHPNW